MLTTPLAPLTGRTPPSSARPGYCPRRQDASWLARWRSWTGCYTVPERPFVALLGGAKVSDKLGVIEALLSRVDTLLVGGGQCFTFLAAQGHTTGASLLEVDYVETCRSLLAAAVARGKRILVPVDILALSPGGTFGPGQDRSGDVSYEGADVPPGWLGLDIGHKTARLFAAEIATAGSVFWNGPMGVFEDRRFGAGTRALAQAVASTDAFTVAGGGDTGSALKKFGLGSRVDHISTGGGASLEYIETGDLPGLSALRESAARQRVLLR